MTSWWSQMAAAIGGSVMPDATDIDVGTGTRRHARRSIGVRLGRLLPRMLLIGAIALLASTIALFAFRALYADKVYPAVIIGDVNVGGLTVDQAVATVEQRAAELEQGSVVFTLNGQTWTPTLAEIGASIDIESSIDEAWALGRGDNAVARLGFANDLLRGDQHIPLRITIDREVLHRWFDSVNVDIGQRAEDATLLVDGTNVTISPERAGTIVDEDAATGLILRAFTTLEPVSAPLPTQIESPRITASDLEGYQAQLAAALDGPILVTHNGQKWDIPASDLVQFLTVDVAYRDGGTQVAMDLDRGALASYLRDGFAGQVNRAPIDARVAWSTDQGGLIALDHSTDGATLRASAFADEVAASFLGDQSPVAIPIVVTRPAVDSTNLGALGIDGLLARGDSNFEGGNEDRDKNIYVGTELLNGELIAPGEEFSFNGAIGEITADAGFVEAGVIAAETIGRDVGGGICQVSTTTFRAALLAGMPMTEWWPHSMRLKGYERDGWTAGFDASILQAGSDPALWGDFRFRNDTDGYMLVQAWNDYPRNYVEIYGNDDGRTVEIGDPTYRVPDWEYEDKEVVDDEKPAGYMEQTQWPTEPMEAIVPRTVTFADGDTSYSEYYSPYQGSENVWVVSPDMKGKSPVNDD